MREKKQFPSSRNYSHFYMYFCTKRLSLSVFKFNGENMYKKRLQHFFLLFEAQHITYIWLHLRFAANSIPSYIFFLLLKYTIIFFWVMLRRADNTHDGSL